MKHYKENKAQLIYDHIINDDGVEFSFCSFGAALIQIKDQDQYLLRSVMNVDDFIKPGCYYGKTIGRVSNRMRGSVLTVDNNKFYIKPNEGKNVLHGGDNGFSQQLFISSFVEEDNCASLVYEYISSDGEGGYPGNMSIKVTYRIYNKGINFDIDYQVSTDKDCPCAITNHAYFTLGDLDISNLLLQINSSSYLPVDKEMIAIKKESVDDVFNFKTSRKIVTKIDSEVINKDRLKGYDHYFYFDDINLNKPSVILENNKYKMKIFSNYEGVQIYTSNFPAPFTLFPKCSNYRDSVAIEPSDSHLSLNILHNNEVYKRTIKYKIERKY